MYIRNATATTIDPSEYLRKTAILEKLYLEVGHICPPEVLRRIHRPQHKTAGKFRTIINLI